MSDSKGFRPVSRLSSQDAGGEDGIDTPEAASRPVTAPRPVSLARQPTTPRPTSRARPASVPLSDAADGSMAELRPVSAPRPADDAGPSADVPAAPQAARVASEIREDPAERLPRVALMGEFSAGKSTLSNLLIGKEALPVNVTATQLPPVWMSYGDEDPYRVDLDGGEEDVDPTLSGIPVADTRFVRIFHESKFLNVCDLIDMPGISDPNMSPEVWRRVIGEADIVIWCSHATQAWRQSEAAVWSMMPATLYEKSLLLLTRMDRILSDRDKSRVIRRVEKETEGMFRKVLPVSLIKALEARGDPDAWVESGADSVVTALVELVDEVKAGPKGRPVSRVRSRMAAGAVDDALGEQVVAEPKKIVMPTRVRPRPLISRRT